VAIVVASAINTSMANNNGEITPRSSPIFRTINSIRPRVFIRIPMADESRQSKPLTLAAKALPPNLPRDATPMISRQNIQVSAPSNKQSWYAVR